MKYMLVVVLASIVLSSCKKPENTAEQATSANSAAGQIDDFSGTWELIFINGERTPISQLFPEQKATVVFNDDMTRITGSTGCNNYNAAITVSGNSIAMGQIASTKKICPGDGDDKFVEILPTITNFNRDGDNLNMSSRGMLMMRFTKGN
jgi:heat shock protein HslJ